MFLRMRLVMIGVRDMRIIRRRGLIRLCCMRCSRMSVSRGRRFPRGNTIMGEDRMVDFEGISDEEGKKIYAMAC